MRKRLEKDNTTKIDAAKAADWIARRGIKLVTNGPPQTVRTTGNATVGTPGVLKGRSGQTSRYGIASV